MLDIACVVGIIQKQQQQKSTIINGEEVKIMIFLLQQIITEQQSKVYKMQTVLFTSFGLLLALLLKKDKANLSIRQQFTMTLFPHQILTKQPQVQQKQYERERDYEISSALHKKKKNKPKKKVKKAHVEQLMIYPKVSYTEEQMEVDWLKKEEAKKIKCERIGKQIQAMFTYFMEDLQTKLAYNGKNGSYILKIPIPEVKYSVVTIEIAISQDYPYELPQINVQTNNLLPLQKQKLFQILKQHRSIFSHTLQQFREWPQQNQQKITANNSIDKYSLSRISSKQQAIYSYSHQYIQFYYPYIFNVCVSISQQLFYKQDFVVHHEQQRIKKINTSFFANQHSQIGMLQNKRQKQKQVGHSMGDIDNVNNNTLMNNNDNATNQNLQLDNNNILKQNQKEMLRQRQKNRIETNKQIYQNILQQIFNQYDNDDKANINVNQKTHEGYVPKYPNSRGRYKIDYEEIQMIGEGGFGSVYRCRNRIDSNIYAIKKMVINYNDPQSRKLLKEVALLSKLNHTNIVRYHQSWLEDTSSVEELIADMSITDPEEIQEFNKIWKQYSSEHPSNNYEQNKNSNSNSAFNNSNSNAIMNQESRSKYPFKSQEDSVIFGEDIIFQADYSDFNDQLEGGAKQILNYQDSSSSSSNARNHKANIKNDTQNINNKISVNSKNNNMDNLARKHSEVHQFPFKILYIVMQYCGSMTLKDFIGKRFNQPNDVKIKLIRGILQGLSYIHSKRIIHRDLKPANIFLIDNSNKVKIGDFGLATIGNIQNNPYQAEIIQYSEKTRGVGTTFYRAPQQLNSSSYDEKIDIYSLGIIMFQLFFKFDTNMERYQVLNKVTKTHKLPKQFNKIQQNSQFEQQIQSCISVIAQQRPTVQKLLQTFRNKYFTQLVSLIANPKHFQFYQLVNHLFVIKNQTNVLMKQNLFRNYLSDQFNRIYRLHRGILFTPLSLVPVIDYETINGIKVSTSRKQKFLLLSERGVVMQYPSNTYVSWIRYAKETMKRNFKVEANSLHRQQYVEGDKQMRRFTFEKVAQFIGGDSKSQFSFKQKYVTAFDIVYSSQNGVVPYFFCQMLKISLLMIESMHLTQRNPPIFLCHSLIFKSLAIQHEVSLINMHKFLLSTTDDKFKTMKNHVKVQYMKIYGLQGNIVKKIIYLMEKQEQNSLDFLKLCQIERIQNGNHKNINLQRQLTNTTQKIYEQIKMLNDCIQAFDLQNRVKWKLQIPSSNTFGMFWNVGPIKGFTSLQEYFPNLQLFNLHLQTSLNTSSQQIQADVSILSNGQFLKNNIFKVVSKCWQHNITVKWNDKIQGEKDLSCRINIILKKKHGKIYLMLRKNHMGLQKKQSQTSQKDKQQKQKQIQYTFPLQNFNYDLLINLIKEGHRKNLIIH